MAGRFFKQVSNHISQGLTGLFLCCLAGKQTVSSLTNKQTLLQIISYIIISFKLPSCLLQFKEKELEIKKAYNKGKSNFNFV